MPNMPPTFPAFLRRTFLMALAAVVFVDAAYADRSDRDQPLNFAADSARVDDARKLNVLSGNVEITKGSMIVHSDRVEVQENPDGSQTATALGGPGGRAYFRQRREGLDEAIEGMAERVIYQGRDDTVHFIGRAIMRRLKGGVLSDEVTGQTIIYDNKTSVFQVVGGGNTTASSGAAPGPTGGRVRGVISPRASEPAPAAGAKEKAQEKGPGLTSTTTLSPPPEVGR